MLEGNRVEQTGFGCTVGAHATEGWVPDCKESLCWRSSEQQNTEL